MFQNNVLRAIWLLNQLRLTPIITIPVHPYHRSTASCEKRYGSRGTSQIGVGEPSRKQSAVAKAGRDFSRAIYIVSLRYVNRITVEAGVRLVVR